MKTIIFIFLTSISVNIYSQSYKFTQSEKTIITIVFGSISLYEVLEKDNSQQEFNNSVKIASISALFAVLPHLEFGKSRNKSIYIHNNTILFKYKFGNKKYKCYSGYK